MHLQRQTIQNYQEGFFSESKTCEGLMAETLAVIQHRNKVLNAVVEVCEEKALLQAQKVDQDLKGSSGEALRLLKPLLGIPVLVKDMFCVQGFKTTAGSKMLEKYRSPFTATAVRNLEEAGAIVVGKCNQDEFAMGASNEYSAFGACANPWDLSCVPGGSSGGSAAAVAAGMVPITLGTDTGGSIRQPANYCGTVGVKPTYGRISRFGMIAFASSLDQAGPLSNSVFDAALTLEIMAGQDKNDTTTSDRKPLNWSQLLMADLEETLEGKTVGWVPQLLDENIESETKDHFLSQLKLLKEAGASLVEIALPHAQYSVPAYYIIAMSEASSNLSRYDGVRYGHRTQVDTDSLEEFYCQTRGEGFGEEVKRRILFGTFCLSSGYHDEFYKKACQVRRLITQDYQKAFMSCDALVTPVSTSTAFRLGEKKQDPLQMYLNDIYTTSANLAGLPAMSLPCGFSKSRLPIGLQVMANHFDESNMLGVASVLERMNMFSLEVPDAVR